MQKKATDPCDICENAQAILLCQMCTKNRKYCADCYKASHNHETKKQHVVVLVADMNKSFTSFDEVMLTMMPDENCNKHPKRPIEYVCKKCGIAICSDCLLVGAHKGHDAASFEEGWSELVDRAPLIERKLQNEYEMIKREFGGIQEMKANEDKDYELHAKKIVEALDKIVTNIQDKKVELLASLKEQKEKQAAEVEKAYMQLVRIDTVLEKRNEIVKLMKEAKSPALYNSIKAAEDFKLPEVTCKISCDTEKKYSLSGMEELKNSIRDMKVYSRGKVRFTSTHKDQFQMINDGLTIKRISTGTLDLPIYSQEAFDSGVHTIKVKLDKMTNNIGLGIHANNTDSSCYTGPFLFSYGTGYGGLSGSFANGQEITMTLDFDNLKFSMKGVAVNTSANISKQKYYFSAEIYNMNDQFSVIE